MDASLITLPALGRHEDQIESAQKRLRAIPLDKSALESEIAQLKTTLAQERESLTALEKERHTKEKDLAEEVERIRQRESKLMEIKTNKEYQAGLKEVEIAKSVISQGEDKILELMVAIDTHAKMFKEAERKLKTEESDIQLQLKSLAEEESRNKVQLTKLQQERDEILTGFTATTKALIDKARLSHAHPLAEVFGERCQSCHIHIPPQLFIEIRKFEKAFQCPACHRVLYYDPTKEVLPEDSKADSKTDSTHDHARG